VKTGYLPAAAADLDLTYRQLDYWTRTGYLKATMPKPGSGHVRTWSDEELAVARLVARLGRTAGIPAGRAAELARTLLSGDDLPMRCPLGQNLFIEVWPEVPDA